MPTTITHALRLPTADNGEFQVLDPTKFEDEATLHLIAEGYANRNDFLADCHRLITKLTHITPFGKLASSSRFSVFAYYNSPPSNYQFRIGLYAPTSPISPPLDAYYQDSSSSPGILNINYALFTSLCGSCVVWQSDIGDDLPLVITPNNSPARQYAAGAILILLPEVQVGAGATAGYNGLSVEGTLRVEMEHMATHLEPIYFAATTCNEGFERLAARAIAIKLGLGDESEQTRGLPPDVDGWALDNKPNLIYAKTPAVVTQMAASSKWKPLVSQASFTVHPKPDSTTNAALDETSSPLVTPRDPIGLWEGGGGYSNGVYRPSHECLMRRKPGSGSLLFKLSQQPFCPVCRIYLYKAIIGEYSTKRKADSVTLATQRSEYEKVHWDETRTYDSMHPDAANQVSSVYTVGPRHDVFLYPEYSRVVDPLAFWGYTCHFSDQLPVAGSVSSDPLNAFYFEQLKVHQSKYYDGPAGNKTKKTSGVLDVRDVFSRMGFYGLKVTFDNTTSNLPTTHEFVIADYVRQNKYKLKRSWGGHLGGDHLYQTGWQLTLIEDRPEWPRLVVELSLVMRGPAPDFDPGGAADALKCYPQILFRWFRKDGIALGVSQFEGTVRAIVNTKHYMYDANVCAPGAGNHFMAGHHIPNTPVMAPDNTNDVSCFADSNLPSKYWAYPETLLKRPDLEFSLPFHSQPAVPILADKFPKPTWAALFDYYSPHVAQGVNGAYSKTFVGVHRHDPTAREGQVRKMYVNHKIAEQPCQREFAPHFITKFPRQGGYDNLHVNGYMGKHNAFAAYPTVCDETSIANEDIVAAPFCGLDCLHLHWRWSLLSESVASIQPHLYWNTAPSYRGWSTARSHTQVGAPLIPPNQRLDIHIEAADHARPKEDRIIDYKATVFAPAPGENQVIMEQGMGWAMIESDMPGVALTKTIILGFPPLPVGLSSISDIFDNEMAFGKIYDYIRFHHEFTYNTSGTTFPDLINPYAEYMKIFGHVQVPDGTTNPTLAWPTNWNQPKNPDIYLQKYRQTGDIFNQALYPAGQQIIEGNVFANVKIEDI